MPQSQVIGQSKTALNSKLSSQTQVTLLTFAKLKDDAIAPTIGPPPELKTEGVTLVCQQCGKWVTTTVTPVPGHKTWLWCFIICLLCGFLGCCLIPFGLPSCQDVSHTCPHCGNNIGKYIRLDLNDLCDE